MGTGNICVLVPSASSVFLGLHNTNNQNNTWVFMGTGKKIFSNTLPFFARLQ